jgi:putative endopeptidase
MGKTIIFKLMFLGLIIGGAWSCNNNKTSPSIDLKDLDLSSKPQVDFYQYANGGWMKANVLPEEYARYGSFDKLQEDNNKRLHDMIEALANSKNSSGVVAQKIGDFYASGMDTIQIEKEGINLIKPLLENINNAKNIKDIQKLIAEFHKIGINPLFQFYGEPDSKNSEMMIAVLYQGGLGLSDRDYYLSADKRSVEIRTAYVEHLKKVFGLLGNSPTETVAKASRIMDLETKLADASFSRLEERDPEKNYNKKSFGDVVKLFSSFDLGSYFSNLGITNPTEINVAQIKFFTALNSLLPQVTMDTWKDYLTWNVLQNTSNYLSSDFVNVHFEFYGKFISGQAKIKPRWKRVLASTSNTLGEAVGQMFVEKYFPPEAKQRMLKLVENLRSSLGERIKQLEWMGDSTKQKALEKLAAIRVKIGYPDKWRDYNALKIKRNSYVTNVLAGNAFDNQYHWNKIGKPVDKTEWDMTPQTVNAYYSPNLNEICFPAGILQPPFFFMNADDAVNYGAIGVVIGHEISHGFDDQGRLFDKNGNLTTWWTNEDSKKFEERTQVLVNQFSSFSVLDTLKANGQLTLGENIADLGGLNISYYALQKALKENPAVKKLDGYTPEQRFFLAYAHLWGQNIRNQEILRRTKEDVHSLGRFRVNGPLPNMPEFHAAFDIKPGDPMFIAKENRAIIW